jgi:hypothetical protein
MKKKVSESAKMHQGMHPKEVKMNKPSPKKNSIFGKVS